MNMSAKVTQYFRIWTLLQTKEPVTIDAIQNLLGVKRQSIPIYIHELKKFFGAEIESIRDGNKVVAYKRLNDVKVPEYRRNNGQYVPKAADPAVTTVSTGDGSAPILDKDNDLVVMDEKTMADTIESLGLGPDTGGGSYSE
jgi:hypothetical protein